MVSAADAEFERELWERVAAGFKARREAEIKARDERNAALDWTWLPERCPALDCRCNWAYSPPAKIHDGKLFQTGEVRCVNCKRVYSPPAAGGDS